MATGDTLAVFFPEANTPPDSNYATFDTMTGTGDTDGHVISVLDFDDTTDEHADFKMVVPSHYTASADFKVRVFWATDDTTASAAVVWTVAGKSITADSDDLDTKAYATAQSFSESTRASAAGEVVVAEKTVTNAQMDSPAVGEVLFVRITRDATAAATNVSGDAELIAVEIQEA